MTTSPPSRPFHWPNGIPSEIRLDFNGDITAKEANEEARGWLLFVTENWVSREEANIPDHDGDYEVRQRRALVEMWAKAEQGFRDSYHERAPLQDALAYPDAALHKCHESFPVSSFVCLAPLSPSSIPKYRSNRSKWIKLYILSCRLDGELGHCLGGRSSHDHIDPNPATFPDPSTFQITDFLSLCILEMANFTSMTMTRKGTVLFMNCLAPWFLVDQDDLDSGLITTVEFKRNGQVRETFRRRAYNMFPVYLRFCVLRKPLWEVKEGREGVVYPDMNSPLDMTQPVIDILEGAKMRGEFLPGFDGARDVWTDDIEIYAPGYLKMEAEGKEADYDHAWLIDPEDAEYP